MSMLSRTLLTAAVVAASIHGPDAASQLTPTRTYFGTNRPLPIGVANPAGNTSPLGIKLLNAQNAVVESAEAVETGEVDLAALFPLLWASQGSKGVLYAQLYAGDEPVGPSVVLQPMTSPKYAQFDARTEQFTWTQGAGVFSGYRAYIDRDVLMTTSEGEILFRMRPDQAPNTVWNFMALGEGGFYTDIIFHRIINSPRRFVIQAGDPVGQGSGGPGYMFDLEESKLPHDFGVISMARTTDPNTNGSQIFICLSREGTQVLDGRYTSFGQAIGGAEVINKIAETPLSGERPINPPTIKSVTLVAAAPRGKGAEPVRAPAVRSPGR